MIFRSKTEFYRAQKIMFLGNTLRTWPTIDEAMAEAGPDLVVGFRHQTTAFNQCAQLVNFPLKKARQRLRASGISEQDVFVSEFLPWDIVTLQGEITYTGTGLQATLAPGLDILSNDVAKNGVLYNDTPGLHRPVTSILKAHMDTPTWEFMEYALNEFSKSPWTGRPCSVFAPVLEVSITNRPVGHFGWRSVWWEIRHY